MTKDEMLMIQTVIRTSSNCPTAFVHERGTNKYGDTHLEAAVPDQKDPEQNYLYLSFEAFIPDVPGNGVDVAAKMLMFMGLEDYPRRAATFYDYISMAYEFGKQHRWT